MSQAINNKAQFNTDYHESYIEKLARQTVSAPAEAIKQEIASTEYQDLQELDRQTRGVRGILGNLGGSSEQDRLVKKLNQETNQYIAGDIFFSDGDNEGAVHRYVKQKESEGIYKGYSKGVDAAFRKAAKDPSYFYKQGTTEFDEDKIVDFIKKHDTEPTKTTSKWHKRADRATNYQNLNSLEASMRNTEGVFSKRQMNILKENNRLFTFKSKADVRQAASIVDTYLLDYLNKNYQGKATRIGFTSMKEENLEINLDTLSKMKIKDIKKAIKDAEKIGDKHLVDIFKAKETIAQTKKQIDKINVSGVARSAVGMLGVDELMSSELGMALRQTRQGVHIATTGAKVVAKGVALAPVAVEKTAVTVGRVVAPELTREAERVRDNAKKAIAEAKSRMVRKASDRVNRSAVGRGVKTIRKVADETTKKISQSWVVRTGQKVAKVADTAASVVLAPIRLTNRLINEVKKKLIMPMVCVFGGLLLVMLIISMAGGGNSVTASGAVGVILSDEEQFTSFQNTYDSKDNDFASKVTSILASKASTVDLRNNELGYGIHDDDENKEGITQNYFYDDASSTGISSNITDIISTLAVVMQNNQSNNKEAALELLDILYQSTHYYSFTESDLYSCTNGCATDVTYFCNEIYPEQHEQTAKYWSTDMIYEPWIFGELYTPTAEQECEVCRSAEGINYIDYAGCTASSVCTHDDLGRSPCSNAKAIYACPGHQVKTGTKTVQNGDGTSYEEDVYENQKCSGDLGCEGHYECNGHNHYTCDGLHNTYADGTPLSVCFGHVDITVDVNVYSVDRIFQIGGADVDEDATSSMNDEIYGMKVEDFNKLSIEEQNDIAKKWYEKQEKEGQ